jgi:hypothetical protein
VGTIGFSQVPYLQGNRGMSSRWISANGTGTDEAQWQYSTGNSPMSLIEQQKSDNGSDHSCHNQGQEAHEERVIGDEVEVELPTQGVGNWRSGEPEQQTECGCE